MQRRIKLAQIDPEVAAQEIGEFVVQKVLSRGATGCVLGLSGGVDSTVVGAIITPAFEKYNQSNPTQPLELVGYMLPSKINNDSETAAGESVAKRLGIRYQLISLEPAIAGYQSTNPEALENKYDKGNLISRIRGTVLNTKASTEDKLVAGTGNRDEDFGVGYYTLFGDGAVHMSPIGALPKRLVKQIATHKGFADIAARIPTAGLEPGQTDFKDLGYSYDAVEIVSEGILQGFNRYELITHPQVSEVANRDIADYTKMYTTSKFATVDNLVDDIIYRNGTAIVKSQILHPATPKVTMRYE